MGPPPENAATEIDQYPTPETASETAPGISPSGRTIGDTKEGQWVVQGGLRQPSHQVLPVIGSGHCRESQIVPGTSPDSHVVKATLPPLVILPAHCRTPVKADMLYDLLRNYDATERIWLRDGFMHGFHLGLDRPVRDISQAQWACPQYCLPNNHSSPVSRPSVVSEKLATEVESCRMIGPFSQSPFEEYCVSPLGLQLKKDPNKFRLIQDLSAPKRGVSINSNIDNRKGEVRYADVATEINLIRSVGQGAVLVKMDIKHAYKLIPVHKDDIPTLGACWLNKLYFDCTLPMGC